MTPTFITADAVASLIGLDDGRAFLARRARLEDDASFPLPLPTCLRPLKWRRDQVEHWASLQGLPQGQSMTPERAATAGPNVVMMAEARRA